MNKVFAGLLLGSAVSLLSVVAVAHIRLMSPSPRAYVLAPPLDAEIKDGPCGRASNERTDVVSTFAPGDTITVTWEETIDHPGHFRISFDDDGDDAFVDPTAPNDLYNPSMDVVLLDDIADKAPPDHSYEAQVTLPDIECQNCTLQLMQVMTDKQANGWGNDEFYYSCANLVLVPGGTSAASSGSGVSSTSGSVSSGPGATTGGATGAGGSPSDPASEAEEDGGCSIGSRSASAPWSSLVGFAGVAMLASAVARRGRR